MGLPGCLFVCHLILLLMCFLFKCNLDDVEDEKHFLCICQVYDGERYLMYEKVMEKKCNFVNLSTEMKFKYLVTHEYKLLGAFISNCWNIQTQILYSTQCKS